MSGRSGQRRRRRDSKRESTACAITNCHHIPCEIGSINVGAFWFRVCYDCLDRINGYNQVGLVKRPSLTVNDDRTLTIGE